MPLYLPPISRRQFLAGALATGAGLLATAPTLAEEQRQADPDRFAILADTHIWKRRGEKYRGVSPSDHFEQARGELLALDPPPAGAMIVGDGAFLQGLADDYTVLADLVKPIAQAGLPLWFLLGNHDHRANFRAAFAAGLPESPLVEKHVAVVESPQANWFLLDSLDVTDHTPGLLGEEQLRWLADALDARPDKPALVAAHHNPDFAPTTVSGLRDTAALFELLRSRKQVKAYLFGHEHEWGHAEREGLHLVNLPTLVWLFDQTQPRGWVDARLRADGMTLTLRSLDPAHPAHHQTVDLAWR